MSKEGKIKPDERKKKQPTQYVFTCLLDLYKTPISRCFVITLINFNASKNIESNWTKLNCAAIEAASHKFWKNNKFKTSLQTKTTANKCV